MPPSNPTEPDNRKWGAPRARLLDQIDREFAETASRTGISEMPPEIRQALAAVPRHRFVPDAEQAYAYRNHPLPIGCSQTISGP